jgi:hypothetical protein
MKTTTMAFLRGQALVRLLRNALELGVLAIIEVKDKHLSSLVWASIRLTGDRSGWLHFSRA